MASRPPQVPQLSARKNLHHAEIRKRFLRSLLDKKKRSLLDKKASPRSADAMRSRVPRVPRLDLREGRRPPPRRSRSLRRPPPQLLRSPSRDPKNVFNIFTSSKKKAENNGQETTDSQCGETTATTCSSGKETTAKVGISSRGHFWPRPWKICSHWNLLGGYLQLAVHCPKLQTRLLAYKLWPFRPRPWHIGPRMPTPIRDDFIRDLVAEELAQMKKGVWARQAKPILLELRSQVRGRRRREISASRRSRAPTPQRHVEKRPYR